MPTVSDHVSAIRSAADDIARELTALAEMGVTVGVEFVPVLEYGGENQDAKQSFAAHVGPFVGRRVQIPCPPMCY